VKVEDGGGTLFRNVDIIYHAIWRQTAEDFVSVLFNIIVCDMSKILSHLQFTCKLLHHYHTIPLL
jgi:hypothetical protein